MITELARAEASEPSASQHLPPQITVQNDAFQHPAPGTRRGCHHPAEVSSHQARITDGQNAIRPARVKEHITAPRRHRPLAVMDAAQSDLSACGVPCERLAPEAAGVRNDRSGARGRSGPGMAGATLRETGWKRREMRDHPFPGIPARLPQAAVQPILGLYMEQLQNCDPYSAARLLSRRRSAAHGC